MNGRMCGTLNQFMLWNCWCLLDVYLQREVLPSRTTGSVYQTAASLAESSILLRHVISNSRWYQIDTLPVRSGLHMRAILYFHTTPTMHHGYYYYVTTTHTPRLDFLSTSLICSFVPLFFFSTASSVLNAMALVVLEDIIKKRVKDLTDENAAKLCKIVGGWAS